MIRSTFSGFNTAKMAMSASQRAIDVAGQNISNINTYGYTRQRLDLSSISPVGASLSNSPFDCKVGQGVMMTGISQIRDPFLDKQYRNQIVKAGTADAMDKILGEIGTIFDETDSNGIRKGFNDFISQLKAMTENSGTGQATTDAAARSAAEVLINAIHQNATALDKVTQDAIDELKDSSIPDINECIKQIVELNESIKNSEVLGSPGLELKDKRNSLIDDLATYLPIQVKYTTQKMGGGTSYDKLDISFTGVDGNVYSLVSDQEGAEFTLTDTAGGVPLKLTVKDALTGVESGNLSDNLSNGVLKGTFDMLNKSEVFDGAGGSNVKGVGFYGKMFDTFVEKFATTMNKLNEITNPDGTTSPPLFTTSDGSTTFTAKNIMVSKDWMNGNVSITRSKTGGAGGTPGSSATENVQLMINELSANKNIKFTYPDGTADGKLVFTGSFIECFNNIGGTQAIERKATSSILKNHMSVLNEIANTKDSVSGVYMDEEVMDLMRYQQSYNAAARLMTTLDEAINTLINNTGVVGR